MKQKCPVCCAEEGIETTTIGWLQPPVHPFDTVNRSTCMKCMCKGPTMLFEAAWLLAECERLKTELGRIKETKP